MRLFSRMRDGVTVRASTGPMAVAPTHAGARHGSGHEKGRGTTKGSSAREEEMGGRSVADQAHMRMKVFDFIFGCVAVAAPIHRACGHRTKTTRTAGTEVREVEHRLRHVAPGHVVAVSSGERRLPVGAGN